MAKKDLPENEDLFSIDTPDVDGADGGWDDWDDVDVVAPAQEEVDDVDVEVPTEEAEAPEVSAQSDEAPVQAYDVAEAENADFGDEEWDDEAPAQEVDADIAAPEEEVTDEVDVDVDAPAQAEVAEETAAVEEAAAPAEAVPEYEVEEAADEDFGDDDWGEDEAVEAIEEAPEEEGEKAPETPDVKLPFDEVIRDYLDEDEVAEEKEQAEEEDDEPAGELQVSDEELAEFLPPEQPMEEASAPVEEETPPTPEEEEAALDEALEKPEEVKSEEEIKREQEELEAYRAAMGESNAEMADVSEYRTFRKKTKTESKSSVPKKSDFDLFANRYKVKTMNAMVAASDPIVYFYNACLRPDGSIMAFNVYQVLQDRFLGKMVPQLFTAVAENSAKIEDLNEANLIEQIKVCAEFPQYDFIVSISSRFFTKPVLLDRLLKLIPDGGVPNLVFAFDCTSLESIAIAAKTGLGAVHQKGVKILLDSTEKVTMTVLSEFDYDFIRIDSRYYEIGNPRAEAYLRLLLSLTKEQGVSSIATFCDSEDLSEYMFFMGVDAIQGNATSRPMRTVPNAVKGITLLPSMLDA